MQAIIKDKGKIIETALRAVGFNVRQESVERIINVIDYVRENPDATLKDIVELDGLVNDLFNQE